MILGGRILVWEDWQETTQIWHRITGKPQGVLPDMDAEVMIRDAELDDVVLGRYTTDDEGETCWRESYTDNLLARPTWWAEKPVPEEGAGA